MALLLLLAVALGIAWALLFFVVQTPGVLVHTLLFAATVLLVVWAIRRPLPRRRTPRET